MMFQRRHYEAIAEILRVAAAQGEGVAFVRSELADLFARDNGNFQRVRFMEACGLPNVSRGEDYMRRGNLKHVL